MKKHLIKNLGLAMGLLWVAGSAWAFPTYGGDDVRTPPKRPPHCDPWINGGPHPTPPPTSSPEPTYYPEPIGTGGENLQAAPAPAQNPGYFDCDDDEPVPTPTPSPDPTPTPVPSDEPDEPGTDEPGQQNFPADPGLFLHGSGILSCTLNAFASSNGAADWLGILAMVLPAVLRRIRK